MLEFCLSLVHDRRVWEVAEVMCTSRCLHFISTTVITPLPPVTESLLGKYCIMAQNVTGKILCIPFKLVAVQSHPFVFRLIALPHLYAGQVLQILDVISEAISISSVKIPKSINHVLFIIEVECSPFFHLEAGT